jgi:hypothetical protein
MNEHKILRRKFDDGYTVIDEAHTFHSGQKKSYAPDPKPTPKKKGKRK